MLTNVHQLRAGQCRSDSIFSCFLPSFAGIIDEFLMCDDWQLNVAIIMEGHLNASFPCKRDANSILLSK